MAIIPNTITKPVIDLSTEAGNVFFLISHTFRIGKQLGKDTKSIVNEMMSSGYHYAVAVFDREFGEYIDLKLPENISLDDFKKALQTQTNTILQKNMTPEKMTDIYTR